MNEYACPDCGYVITLEIYKPAGTRRTDIRPPGVREFCFGRSKWVGFKKKAKPIETDNREQHDSKDI